EVRLTDTSFDLEKTVQLFFAKGSPYFLGDYEGLATVGNDFVAAWAQPHDSDFDSIYFRRAFATEPLLAAGASRNAATLTSQEVAGPLPEAIQRWHAASLDTSGLGTPGNQGEQGRMDLPTVLGHEFGHLLGYRHTESGAMDDLLAADVRRTPAADTAIDWP